MPAPSRLLCAIALVLASPATAQRAITDTGPVRGATEAGVESFKGIPFAAPPIAALRWRAPQPLEPWTETRDATAYGHDCMQLPFPSDAAPLGTAPSEDCLVANVWKPAGTKPGARLPVIVWIYGGGFVNGGSSPPTYAGANLARRGAVVVSFNYRLGRFGTFAHPALTRADADRGLLGNYGFLDQLAALRWVRRNAAAFGGDAANVTIVGESAGGMSVHFLLTAPLAQGLFAKAAILSGGDAAMRPGGIAEAEAIGARFAAAKGVPADAPDAAARLRALPAQAIVDGLNLASAPPVGAPTHLRPFADGRIAVDPAAAYAAGRFARVPVMIGATSADIGGPTGYMIAGARRIAATLADAGVPTWAYRFSYVAQSIDEPGAPHATDIPFFFDTAAIKYGEGTTPRDRRVARTMADYLVNFARSGTPDGPGLPRWPRYARATDTIMDFAATGEAIVGRDPLGARIDAARP